MRVTYQFDFIMEIVRYQRQAEQQFDIPLFLRILVVKFKPIVKVFVYLIVRLTRYELLLLHFLNRSLVLSLC